jgi:hypothetical protein
MNKYQEGVTSLYISGRGQRGPKDSHGGQGRTWPPEGRLVSREETLEPALRQSVKRQEVTTSTFPFTQAPS